MERRMHYRIYGMTFAHAKTKKSALRRARKEGVGCVIEVYCCGKFKAAYIFGN